MRTQGSGKYASREPATNDQVVISILQVALGSSLPLSNLARVSLSQGNAQQLSCLLGARHRKVRRLQQPHLHKKRSLIPIESLVRDFPALEFHHHHVAEGPPACRLGEFRAAGNPIACRE